MPRLFSLFCTPPVWMFWFEFGQFSPTLVHTYVGFLGQELDSKHSERSPEEVLCLQDHWTPPAPMKTVLMGGSEETRSCTSEDDGTRCWESSVSWEENEEGTPNMQGADPDDEREGSEEETQDGKKFKCFPLMSSWLLTDLPLYSVFTRIYMLAHSNLQ